jgi:hypothetical protein
MSDLNPTAKRERAYDPLRKYDRNVRSLRPCRLEALAKDSKPFVLQREDVLAAGSTRGYPLLEELQQRFEKNEITYDIHEHTSYLNAAMVNACVSRRYACDAFTFWIKDKIWFPLTKFEVRPHEDLPAPLRDDFEEAASVLELSPRTSVALLRLCIQKTAIAVFVHQ